MPGGQALDDLFAAVGPLFVERLAAKRAAADQSAAPPVDHELVRAFVFDELGPEEEERVRDLIEKYQVWEDAKLAPLREQAKAIERSLEQE